MARPVRNAEPEPIDRVFQALGDPTRRRMMELLSDQPRSVGVLAQQCGISLTAVAQHLRLLEAAGLARTRKLGRVRTCQIDPGGLASAQQWILDRRSLWEKRLDLLGDMLPDA